MKCNKCGKDKPETDFYVDKKSPTGHTRDCKECRLAHVSSKYYPKNRRSTIATICKQCGCELTKDNKIGKLCKSCYKLLLDSRKVIKQRYCEQCGVLLTEGKQTRFCGECAKNKNKINSLNSYKRLRDKHPQKFWAYGTISNHKRRGHIINITIDYLEQLGEKTKNCPICGCELDWRSKNKHSPNAATLDRIKNEKELNPSNVQIICRKCNTTKLDRTMEEFIEYCKMVITHR